MRELTHGSAEEINKELANLNSELRRVKAKIDARLAELHAARLSPDQEAADDSREKASVERQGSA